MKAANFKHLPIILRGLLFYLLLVVLFFKLSRTKNRPIKMTTIKDDIWQTVYLLLLKNGFHYQQAKMILAQAAHETGNFTSPIFKENNNLFGMKFPTIRQTKAIGENKGHAVYKSIEKSVEDFALYYKSLKYLSSYSTINSYIDALKNKNYFEASAEEYKRGLNYFYDLYFCKKNEA
jgi:uncharacterized FlgJ-related protein